jgi:hypothetical protein
MQPCNRIYYSKIYWILNMFRAAHCSSSGAPNCICSLLFIYTCGDRPLSRLNGNSIPTQFSLSLDNGRSPHVCTNKRLQIQFRAPDDERYVAETCWAFNKFWNNKSITRWHLVVYFYWLIFNDTVTTAVMLSRCSELYTVLPHTCLYLEHCTIQYRVS